jgi:hypothetical protein
VHHTSASADASTAPALAINVDGREVARATVAQLKARVELSTLAGAQHPVSGWKSARAATADGSLELRLHDFSKYGTSYRVELYWDEDVDAPAVGLFTLDTAHTPGHQVPSAKSVEIETAAQATTSPHRDDVKLAVQLGASTVVLTLDKISKLSQILPPEDSTSKVRTRQRRKLSWRLPDVVALAGGKPDRVTHTVAVDSHGERVEFDGHLASQDRTMLLRQRNDGSLALVIWTTGKPQPIIVRELQRLEFRVE